MLARLQRLGPSERRALPVQRSGFAEKQHNLALGSRSGWISPQRGTISANGKNTLSKCIELHAGEFTASGSIGSSSSAVATVGFAEKQHNLVYLEVTKIEYSFIGLSLQV